MTSLTRGPLPARVYWTRRVLVLGTAFLLVFGLARLLTGGSDASSRPAAEAVQAAGTPTSAPVAPTVTAAQSREPKKHKTRKEPVLAQPDGPCDDRDIAVTPDIDRAVAGDGVFMVFKLRTISAAACTWRVSPATLTVKITSGNDEIWSSRECPKAIPVRDVTVRSAVNTKVGVRWSGRRSDDDCSKLTTWALPGWYHVAAAALAGEPSDLQFELERPRGQVITQSPEPEQERDGKTDDGARGQNRDGDRKHDELKHR